MVVVGVRRHARHHRHRVRGDEVGFSFGKLFKGLGHTFSHMLKHITAIAVESVGPMFGIPPGVAGGLVELLMHAHAGDHKARAKVAHLAADPKLKSAMTVLSSHIKAHPHFAQLKAHAA